MRSLFLRLSGVLALMLTWCLLSYGNYIDTILIPTPHATALETIRLLSNIAIYKDITASLLRCLSGLLIAMLIGVPTGFLFGMKQEFYTAFEALLDFGRSVPATALFPLGMLLLGIGDAAKIGVVVFSGSLILILNAYYGVTIAEKRRTEVLKVMKASSWQTLRYQLFWEALPHLFSGLRIATSLALALVIVTEMFLGTQVGLGSRIIDAQATYRIEELYSSILITGTLGYTLNKLISANESRALHWRN